MNWTLFMGFAYLLAAILLVAFGAIVISEREQ
jgi:hypothetical protein